MKSRCYHHLPFILLMLFSSCKKSEKSNTETNISANDTLKGTAVEKSTQPQENLPFPKMGTKISDFVSGGYKIQYQAEGDLNKDGLPDVVIVLKSKTDTLGVEGRTVLILLKNADKTYYLDKTSEYVLQGEHTEDGYKIYDTEEISIEDGQLNINLYGTGPSGNLFSRFKYSGKEFILTYIETYNVGAGSHQALYYDLQKGELIEEITNTLEEDMPSKTKTFHLKKEKFLFENVSPDEIIVKAYEKLNTGD